MSCGCGSGQESWRISLIHPNQRKRDPHDTNVDIRFVPKGSGKVVITSDVDIQGTSTTVNSTTLDVDDKNITMGSVASPSDIGGLDALKVWLNQRHAAFSDEARAPPA